MSRTKKEPKPKKPFLSGYKTYDDSHGRGNIHEWRAAWEQMSHGEAKAVVAEEEPLAIMGFVSMPNKADLDKRYRELVRKHHPDMGGKAEEFKKVQAAWSLLRERIN